MVSVGIASDFAEGFMRRGAGDFVLATAVFAQASRRLRLDGRDRLAGPSASCGSSIRFSS
jgi:hypothetical protein